MMFTAFWLFGTQYALLMYKGSSAFEIFSFSLIDTGFLTGFSSPLSDFSMRLYSKESSKRIKLGTRLI